MIASHFVVTASSCSCKNKNKYLNQKQRNNNIVSSFSSRFLFHTHNLSRTYYRRRCCWCIYDNVIIMGKNWVVVCIWTDHIKSWCINLSSDDWYALKGRILWIDSDGEMCIELISLMLFPCRWEWNAFNRAHQWKSLSRSILVAQ